MTANGVFRSRCLWTDALLDANQQMSLALSCLCPPEQPSCACTRHILIVSFVFCHWCLCVQIRYDNELQNYLKSQGLRSLKAKTKKKPEPRPVSSLPVAQPRRETNVATATMQPPPAHTSQAVTQQQQLAQAFMGLPIAGMSGGIPMAVGMPPGMMGMLPHFSQV